MNQNHPFFSTNTNCYDESFKSSAPTQVNGENVILSQEQQRRVCDTLNTSIIGNPNPLPEQSNKMNQMLYAQKQYYPGGVLFTFPPTPSMNFGQQPFAQQGLCCQCPPLSYPTPIQTAPVQTPIDYSFQPPTFQQPMPFVNTFFPSSLEYQQMNQNALQQPYQFHREPYQLRFHNDKGTSCSNMPKDDSQVSSTDYSNINGVIQRLQQDLATLNTCKDLSCSCPIEYSSKVKKLVLSKPVPELSGHVIDVLNEAPKGNKDDKPRVSFSDQPVDEGAQVDTECNCSAKENRSKSRFSKKSDSEDESSTERPKKRTHKKKKKQKKRSKSSSDTSVSSGGDDPVKNQKKTSKESKWGKKDKTDTTASESSDSEKAYKENQKNKKRKNKKQKTKSKDLKDEGSQTDSSEYMNETSEEMDYSTDAEHCKCD